MSEIVNSQFVGSADAQLISFKDFLALVPRKDAKQASVWSFNAHLSYSNEETSDTSVYEKKAVALVRGSLYRIALSHLLLQATHEIVWKAPIHEIHEDQIFKALVNFSVATHLVKFGSKRFAVLCPDDFAVVEGERGCALVNFYPSRTNIYEVMPWTLDEAKAKVEADLKLRQA